MSKYLGVCCIILSQGIYLFLTLSACLLTLLYLSLSQLNSKFIWILLKLGSMSTSQECPLSNCSIAWNSILVGSLSQSQYSEGERNMLAMATNPLRYYSKLPRNTKIIHSAASDLLIFIHRCQCVCQRSIILLVLSLIRVDCYYEDIEEKKFKNNIFFYNSNVINNLCGESNENQSEISAFSDFYCFPKH